MTGPPALFRWMLKSCGSAGLVAIAFCIAVLPTTAARADTGEGSQYTALAPVRLLDTRTGAQAGPGRVIEVQVTGPSVPVAAVAVNLNLVATNNQQPGYLTVYPVGSPRPQASALNYSGTSSISNAATVQIGTGGRIAIWASAQTDVVVDLGGYYGPAAPGSGLFEPMVATRVLDTRSGLGATPARLQPGQPIVLSLAGQAGIPQTGAGAAVLSLTAVSPSGPGFLTVWAAGSNRPSTSDINFQAGDVVSNRVSVRLGSGESLLVAAGGADTDVVADLEGWYTDSSNPQALGTTFHPLTPARILDSRSAGSATGLSFAMQVAGLGGAPLQGVAAVAINLTTTLSSGTGVLSMYPDDSARPLSAVAQFSADQDRAQAVTTRVAADGRVAIFLSRPTQVVADLSGWFGPIQASSAALLPGQPVGVTATVQGTSLLVGWQPPAVGGPVASYAIAASDGSSLVVPGSQLQALFGGLRPGTPYTFTVTAVGPIGSGPASRPAPAQTIVPAPGLLTFTPQLEQLVQGLPGVVSVSIREVGGLNPQSWSLSGQQDFDAASTYKLLAIMGEAQAIFGGLKSDQDRVCFQDSDYEDGPFGDYIAGSCFTIAELAARAGIHSDNTAGHMLVRDLGGSDALNAWAAGLGAANPRFHDPNVTTADDLTAVLLAYAQGRVTSPAGQGWVAQFLSHTDFDNGVPAGIPPGSTYVHKVGFRGTVVNDAAWISTGPAAGYVLVVLTDGSADGWSSIASISQTLWRFESQR